MSIKKTGILCLPILLVALLVFSTGCITIVGIGDGPLISGSGSLETRDMDYDDFTKIEVGYAFKADITKSTSFSVSITLDDNLFEYLVIQQAGDTLRINLDPNHSYRSTTQRAEITLPELHGLELSGASRGEISGFSSADTLQLEASGASSLTIDDVRAGSTRFNVSGASRVSGSITITEGDFIVSGASSVDLDGTATDIQVDASGASVIRLSEFAVNNASIDLSGASSATVNVSEQLDVHASGASRVVYSGNPSLGSVSVSGGSTITEQ
ncbi:MAG: DUF2807 domain-containing protein [Dehalococcoidales bacterium]|nr:MAG: DUF2807 domain-containing protein [Dehalococcoidales bacterium]